MKVHITIFISVVVSFSQLFAQTLTGRILDGTTKEVLPYATVSLLKAQQSTYTNERGEFTLVAIDLSDSDSLEIAYVGYSRTRVPAIPYANELFKYILLQGSVDLPTVEVRVPIDYVGNSSSILSPRISELESLPSLFGENDPLKGLAFLPGISTGLEGTAGVHIRGGNANQTDLLIDGVRVYNINHIGGFISAVPSYGVKDITVYKGGAPARFGGRLSGVLDISLRDGRKDKHTQELTLGTALVRLGAEGPIGKRSSYIVHGRLGYPTLLYSLFSAGGYTKGEQGSHQNFSLADFYAKYSYRYEGWDVSLSTFQSGDWGFDQDAFSNLLLLDEFAWANSTYALNLRRRLTTKTEILTTLSYLDYRYDYTNLSVISQEDGQQRSLGKSAFNTDNYAANLRLVHSVSDHLQLTTGIESLRQKFVSDFEAINPQATDEKITRQFSQSSNTTSGYVQADFNHGPLDMMVGLRASAFAGDIDTMHLQPRARVSLQLRPGLFLNGGYDGNAQFDHQLRTDLSIFPNEFWVQANSLLKSSTARQTYIGLGGRLSKRSEIQWSVEVFQKRMQGLARIKPGEESAVRFETELSENEIATNGQGRARGAEFFLRKTSGDVQFWLAYTLSKSERRYGAINEGQWFVFTFDRPHDLSARISRELTRGWSANASFVFQSGIAFTAPIATTAEFDIYGSYNNARYPPFHVLNLGAEKTWVGKKRPSRSHQLSLSLYNAYNRANAYRIEVRLEREEQTDPATGDTQTIVRRKLATRSLLPVVPGISYKVRFGG